MEVGEPSTRVNKPSGLPRPSRLPILGSKSTGPSIGKSEDVIQPLKYNNASAKVQKSPSVRPSSSARTLPRKTITTATPGRITHSRAGQSSSSTLASKSSSSALRPSAPRLSSRGNQQKIPSPKASRFNNPEDEENHDQLSSLDSFRAASRQGFHDELQESVESGPLPEVPRERKKSRPSLSDRTMESIQNLPSTPKDRRRSDFFSPVESPMGPPPRPTSSLSRNGGGNGSRPTTSDGNFAQPFSRPSTIANRAPSSAKPATRTQHNGLASTLGTPSRRIVSSAFSNKVRNDGDSIPSSLLPPIPPKRPAPSPTLNGLRGLRAPSTSKTLGAKPSKPRPSLSSAFGPAVLDAPIRDSRKASPPTRKLALDVSKPTASNSPNASSVALREQIAAAKAAARKEKAKHDSAEPTPSADGNMLDMQIDPFNQAPRDEKHILRSHINSARMDGRLNVAAMNLKQIPQEVLRMYDAAAMEESKVNWAEVVDLTRFNAADNEIEEFAEGVFPDKSAEEFDMDDQSEGNQFGGLEMLDLHGNRLQALPMGLRRLERLTMLNLAHNKLDNDALDVICQIVSLKDLKLGHNALSGSPPVSICNLQGLEVLDLQANRLLALPEALCELVSLKVLNVSGNQLTALPMEALQELPLTELDASNNALIASLFPAGVTSAHSTLRTLNVASNSLAALTFDETLNLPRLRTLDVTNNHLTGLPPVISLSELITLTASDNKIGELPYGFSTLRKVRNVNFTGNELRLIDPEIGNMEQLESLILASNPLREKKFLTMGAADIKRDLKARLAPEQIEGTDSVDAEVYHDARHKQSLQSSAPSTLWILKPHGVLDLAGRKFSDEMFAALGSFLQENEVKRLKLQDNLLKTIPPALSFGTGITILDLSGNALGLDYLSHELEMPSLQELYLTRCSIKSLESLMTQLQAPRLHTLNIAANKLSSDLPTLRYSFPILTTLVANDNGFISITADSLRGLHVANLASNNIEQLPPEVGLLWDEGLKNLEIGSNAFRVPNFRILEKGTEATLRWLRNRIPAA